MTSSVSALFAFTIVLHVLIRSTFESCRRQAQHFDACPAVQRAKHESRDIASVAVEWCWCQHQPPSPMNCPRFFAVSSGQQTRPQPRFSLIFASFLAWSAWLGELEQDLCNSEKGQLQLVAREPESERARERELDAPKQPSPYRSARVSIQSSRPCPRASPSPVLRPRRPSPPPQYPLPPPLPPPPPAPAPGHRPPLPCI